MGDELIASWFLLSLLEQPASNSKTGKPLRNLTTHLIGPHRFDGWLPRLYALQIASGGISGPATCISRTLSRISSLEGLNRLNLGRAKAVSGCRIRKSQPRRKRSVQRDVTSVLSTHDVRIWPSTVGVPMFKWRGYRVHVKGKSL